MVIVPAIHMNGTAAKDLRNDAQAAFDAVNHAMERLALAAPNGRDYYVQDAGAIQRVQAQHELRMGNLRAVREELAEIVNHVQAVMDFEEERRRVR